MAFNYSFEFQKEDPNLKSTFQRSFVHQDWVDGQDVVQAQKTPDEEGFNERLHRIENDLEALNGNVVRAFAAIAQLRSELHQLLQDIKTELNRPPAKTSKESKDKKDTKDAKDAKDTKDTKDKKDTKDAKDTKDKKDTKDGKDAKDTKDTKDKKDTKDTKDKKDGKDGKELSAIEKQIDRLERVVAPPDDTMLSFLFGPSVEPAAQEAPPGRSFIRAEERPPVGERVIREAVVERPAKDEKAAEEKAAETVADSPTGEKEAR